MGSFYLQDRDRVVFYGDSITEQRYYSSFVETYVLTRFPRLRVDFINSGWGGDRVTGGGGGGIDLRLRRDVLAYRPTVVTIMLGMNDGRYRPFDATTFASFSLGYRHIVDQLRLQLPNARLTVIEPSPYDDITRPPEFADGYNAVLKRYGEFVRGLASYESIISVDFNSPVVAMLAKAKALEPGMAAKIIPDRVHPTPGGHLIMAAALLRAWHAPAVVTTVQIDGASGRVIRAVNSHVRDLRRDDGLTWTQLDGALPMPVNLKDPLIELVVRSSDFTAELNQEQLVVTGLEAGGFTLKIDGKLMGTFTSEELARGVNLALLPTPMYAQARAVNELTLRHNNLHATRWRGIEPLNAEATTDALKRAIPRMVSALDEEEASVVARQRTLAQPEPHRYEVIEANAAPLPQ
ncbi:MAG TPA: SGNH/GDSL hydrolase family protein [Opitutaceae bacterium]|nr:SGNH/GDSL hydrolase family protein [Opitutaceae bacterium]